MNEWLISDVVHYIGGRERFLITLAPLLWQRQEVQRRNQEAVNQGDIFKRPPRRATKQTPKRKYKTNVFLSSEGNINLVKTVPFVSMQWAFFFVFFRRCFL